MNSCKEMTYERGKGTRVIFWLTEESRGQDQKAAAKELGERIDPSLTDFCLRLLTVKDWNLELSPWQAEIPKIGQSFGGGGAHTYERLKQAMSEYPGSRCYVAGYSLAGLFALWACSREPGFAGAAGCSSTMWFPGWLEYARSLHFPPLMYLSLGGKEHKTSQPFIATILERTKEMETIVKADPAVIKYILEMNRGGHFTDPDGRVIKGMEWLLRQDTVLYQEGTEADIQ